MQDYLEAVLLRILYKWVFFDGSVAGSIDYKRSIGIGLVDLR